MFVEAGIETLIAWQGMQPDLNAIASIHTAVHVSSQSSCFEVAMTEMGGASIDASADSKDNGRR